MSFVWIANINNNGIRYKCIHDSVFMHQNFWEHHRMANARKASALFSQLASPVNRCRVEWKSRLKGSTLSIKKIAWDFQRSVSFHGSCLEKAKKGQHFMCKKKTKSKIVCEFYFATAITFYLPRMSKSSSPFLSFQHRRPAQPLHLYACKVDDNGALAVVQLANRWLVGLLCTCRPIVHL